MSLNKQTKPKKERMEQRKKKEIMEEVKNNFKKEE